jgi:hypothetical protein
MKKILEIACVIILGGLISCQSEKRITVSKYCPYATGDFLEYHNQGIVHYQDGNKQENTVYIIYEVIHLANSPRGSEVRLKRYYTDLNGTVEDSVTYVYTKNRIVMIRPDDTPDSLKFILGDNRPQTLENTTDSLGMRVVTKIVDNNATFTNSKQETFTGCLKVVTTNYDTSSPDPDFVFQKISYYKDTILVKFTSIDHRERERGVESLEVDSELESYNIFAWR